MFRNMAWHPLRGFFMATTIHNLQEKYPYYETGWETVCADLAETIDDLTLIVIELQAELEELKTKG